MPEELPRKNLCPLLNEPCRKLDCKWYMSLTGENPQNSEQRLEGWDCAINWLVYATLDVRKQIMQSGDGIQQATESSRNVSAEAAQAALRASIGALGVAMRYGVPTQPTEAQVKWVEDANR